jgi:hypothetical protein
VNSLEILAEEIHVEHTARFTRRPGRPRRLRPNMATVLEVKRTTRIKLFKCEHCQRDFYNHDKGPKHPYRFCSSSCSSLSRRAFDMDAVRDFAARGVTLSQMATEMGITIDTARRILKRHGLYESWQRQRYKKCKDVLEKYQ